LKSLAIETVTKFASTSKSLKILKKYQNLIPLVIQALDSNDEEMIMKVFNMLNEYVEVKRILLPHLSILVETALKVAANSDFSLNLRELCFHFMEMIAETYKKVLCKNKDLLNLIISYGFKIASQNEGPQEEGEETRKIIFNCLAH